jgi:hypothetical protein
MVCGRLTKPAKELVENTPTKIKSKDLGKAKFMVLPHAIKYMAPLYGNQQMARFLTWPDSSYDSERPFKQI